MNNLRSILSLLILFFTIIPAIAQQNQSNETGFQRTTLLDKSLVLPNTPEAASLGKFGEFNIDPYVGSAAISVPIHTIAGKTVSVPINLLYSGTAVVSNN